MFVGKMMKNDIQEVYDHESIDCRKNTGVDRIKRLGIMQIVLSVISTGIIAGIYEKIGLTEWNRFDDAGSITFGIFLILLAMVVRYGAELEQKTKAK